MTHPLDVVVIETDTIVVLEVHEYQAVMVDSGGGGGSGGIETFSVLAGEDLLDGQLLAQVDGEVVPAHLDLSTGRTVIIGVAVGDHTAGTFATVGPKTGLRNVRFAVPPDLTDVDEYVYLGQGGLATLTPPTAGVDFDKSIVLVGQIQGADGVTINPSVWLTVAHVIDL